MKRAVYDKQFKMAAVKHAQSVFSLSKTLHENWASVGQLYVAGSTNTMNMEKVRFRVMETHFSTPPTKLRNYKNKLTS